jgi:hypothetical protein
LEDISVEDVLATVGIFLDSRFKDEVAVHETSIQGVAG